MLNVRVNLGPRSYHIVEGYSHQFASFVNSTCPKAKRLLLVCDSNTEPLAKQLLDLLLSASYLAKLATVPAGEASKSPLQLHQLYDALADLPADRSTPVVAIGGGVIGDLAGFAAATYNRGLPLIMVPTSLLAMVDSSVGGKVGINHPRGKNLIGAFHQPAGVWIDLQHLNSLPEREFRSGLAEVVKYGVILDPALFDYLERNAEAILQRQPAAISHIVQRSCELKAQVVEQDEREETGLRAILNYGHTFAHAFETVGGYGSWLHGEAVAAGMVCASRLAEKLGRIPSTITQRQIDLLARFQLPIQPLQEWVAEEMIEVMRRDKKAEAGKLRFVLPSCLGSVELVDNIREQLVHEVLLNKG
jgi:3-dehydroquinate synthase